MIHYAQGIINNANYRQPDGVTCEVMIILLGENICLHWLVEVLRTYVNKMKNYAEKEPINKCPLYLLRNYVYLIPTATPNKETSRIV